MVTSSQARGVQSFSESLRLSGKQTTRLHLTDEGNEPQRREALLHDAKPCSTTPRLLPGLPLPA